MSRENYTDLSNSYLYMRVKIVKADNSNIDAAPKAIILLVCVIALSKLSLCLRLAWSKIQLDH